MRRLLLTSVSAAALSLATPVVADTASIGTYVTGMGVLENEWIRAGINLNTGTFGSGGGTSPGLLFDPEGTGTFNPSYDYLTPGSPFDGFSVKVDGTNYANNNTGATAITKTGEGLGPNAITWSGAVADTFTIDMNYSLLAGQPFVNGIATIGALTDIGTLSFGKYIDPDSQGMPGDSSSTDNVLGYGVIPSTNVAFSEATTSRYALGIYTTDTNVTAGIESWTQEADGYSGTNYTDADGNPVNYGNSDDTIGISWTWTGVSAGDMLEASYAYIFGPSAFEAADDAITGGAGGGDTTTTSSWGTLEDVGSATDAAESGASGGSTPEPVITYSDPVVDTDRPVLTASITHHTASETATVQTIDREKTTTVTTPMEIITYTDGVETARTDTTSDIVTTVTDPGSFTGRIDQVATIQNNVSIASRSLSLTDVSGIGMDSKMGNGMNGTTKAFQTGGVKELENGLTIGLGGGRVISSLSGNGDSAEASSDMFGLHLGRNIDQGRIELGLRYSMTEYSFNRTIGDFAAHGDTKGSDASVSLRFTGNGEKIQPIFGITKGRNTINGYTETGSIQAIRTVEKQKDDYTFATVGGNINLGLVNITALHHTDGVNNIAVGFKKETDKVTFNISAQRTMTKVGDTNSIRAGINWKF